MNIFERLARPLAHGADLGAVARSTLKTASPTDVEWLMVGLPPTQEHLIRARYQLDAAAKAAAWQSMFEHAMRQGWSENAPQGTVERLTLHALKYWLGWSSENGERVLSPHICRKCEGVGGVMFEAKALVCKACEGSCRREIGPHTIMRALEIKPGRVRQVWVDRHQEIIKWLDHEEGLALTHLIYRLTGHIDFDGNCQ